MLSCQIEGLAGVVHATWYDDLKRGNHEVTVLVSEASKLLAGVLCMTWGGGAWERSWQTAPLKG